MKPKRPKAKRLSAALANAERDGELSALSFLVEILLAESLSRFNDPDFAAEELLKALHGALDAMPEDEAGQWMRHGYQHMVDRIVRGSLAQLRRGQ